MTLPPSPELRGARKRARALATRARHLAHQTLQHDLSTPPLTSQAASNRWDNFYATKHALFKDRHLLRAQFPEMMSESVRRRPDLHIPPLASCKHPLPRDEHCDLTLVEAGCGVGNGLFPVLRANGRLFAYALDYSERAIQLIRESDEYRTDRVHALRADLSQPSTYVHRILDDVNNGVDFVTALWTLSALSPGEQLQRAAQGLARLLKGGGLLFVRDYAVGDMRQHKFEKGGRCLEGRLYLRGDGTFAYFFEADELRQLFQGEGLVCEVCEYVEREVVNRKEGVVMARRWIHAKFSKPCEEVPCIK